MKAGDTDRRAANGEMDVPDDHDTREIESEAPETEDDGSQAEDAPSPEDATAERDTAAPEDPPQASATPEDAPPDSDDPAEVADTTTEPETTADSADASTKPDPTTEPDPAIEVLALESERDRLRDQHLRLAADFDNFRRRTEDRLRQRWGRAQADLVRRLLEPLDDLSRVTALEPDSEEAVDPIVKAIVEGVDLVEQKFFRALAEAGVEVVDPAGEAFDPNTMEAMMRETAESEDDDDTVARVFQRGYTLKGMLIRPARVSVFKAD